MVWVGMPATEDRRTGAPEHLNLIQDFQEQLGLLIQNLGMRPALNEKLRLSVDKERTYIFISKVRSQKLKILSQIHHALMLS